MTFLEQLQSHKGGLLRLKTQLYWYDGRGYDNNFGRVCLILDATTGTAARRTAAARTTTTAARRTAATTTVRPSTAAEAAAFLLIDGQSQWVLVAEKDVELL